MPSIRTQQLQMCTIETSQARLNAAVMMKYCLTITAFKKKAVLSALDKEVNQRWSLSLYFVLYEILCKLAHWYTFIWYYTCKSMSDLYTKEMNII